ncbi:hypothetical protein [Spiroplasma ixodetis]|uniref:Transposase n=1 Tax=Spiroplasma ixodetis TaxID=2141 RepID=A0ABN7BYS1_9MOLU
MIQQHKNPQHSKLLNPHKTPSTNVYQKTVLKKVAIPNLFLWRKRKKETGHIKPILNYQKGHSHKIKDLDELKNYLAQNKDVTVQKVIEKFDDMTKETVYNYFKKLNYTYKKNFSIWTKR